MALLPYFSKNSWARSMYSRRKITLSLSALSKSFGPSVRPIQYPVLSPAIAARLATMITSGSDIWPLAANTPPVISKVSPGRKKPTNIPDSANIMIAIRMIPPLAISAAGSSIIY